MNLQIRKYKVIEKVMLLNENQLESLESTLEQNLELDKSLDRAIDQIEHGKVKPHNKVRKKYEKWL